MERPSADPTLPSVSVGQGPLGGRAGSSETADAELRVRQHGACLEREHGIVGRIGEIRRAFRTRQILRHVAGQPAQAAVGHEQEGVAASIPQALGHGAGLLEQRAGRTFLDPRQASDLEQCDARGQSERESLGRFGKGRDELDDPPAVPCSGCGIVARDAPARAFVPGGGLQVLARLIEVMGEQRGT